MKVGILTFLKWTIITILIPWLFLIITKFDIDRLDYIIVVSTVLVYYIIITFGLSQIFHFKKNELVIWYFNPFKKSIHISYESITKVEVFRGLSFNGINWFRFKTTSGEIIINNNIFIGWELKKIKRHFEKLNIDCEL